MITPVIHIWIVDGQRVDEDKFQQKMMDEFNVFGRTFVYNYYNLEHKCPVSELITNEFWTNKGEKCGRKKGKKEIGEKTKEGKRKEGYEKKGH